MSLRTQLTNNLAVRTAIKIYRHFDTVPAAVQLKDYRYYILSNIAYTISWIIHSVWLFAFLSLELYPMAALQVLSIGIHAVAINFNRRAHHLIAMTIGMSEVVVHQVIAIALLGWAAGFEYIIPAIALFPFLKADGKLAIKLVLITFCLAGFLYPEVCLKDKLPAYSMSPVITEIFNYSNIFFLFGLMSMWGFFLTKAILKTEHILNMKNKELFEAEKAAAQAEMRRQLEIKDKDAEIYRLRNVELRKSNEEILLRNKIIEEEKKRSDDLLLNILPAEVAEELKYKGSSAARHFDAVTVMFTDFVNFSGVSEAMAPQELIDELDFCFKAFDGIIGKYDIEKIKTIGDAYLAVSGMPKANPCHAADIINAALEITAFIRERKNNLRNKTFDIRVGVHSGSVVAGIVGVRKFAYDIWGDTVNVAARMEQNSEPGMINISQSTFALVSDHFVCAHRGMISVKNKGEMDMYFVLGHKSGSVVA